MPQGYNLNSLLKGPFDSFMPNIHDLDLLGSDEDFKWFPLSESMQNKGSPRAGTFATIGL